MPVEGLKKLETGLQSDGRFDGTQRATTYLTRISEVNSELVYQRW